MTTIQIIVAIMTIVNAVIYSKEFTALETKLEKGVSIGMVIIQIGLVLLFHWYALFTLVYYGVFYLFGHKLKAAMKRIIE